MPILLDTNVAIHFRDLDPTIFQRVIALHALPAISVVTRVELEGGVLRDPRTGPRRRLLLDRMLSTIATLPFTDAEASRYGRIVAAVGYSRARTLDRMIAAQAIEAGATLITINGQDFRDIPGLTLEVWLHPPT